METDERATFLTGELDAWINETRAQRRKFRRRALLFKILAVCFAAAITVMLGLKVDAAWADLFRNIALILGASITIFNAIDAFYDFVGRTINSPLLTRKIASSLSLIRIFVSPFADAYLRPNLKLTH